LAEDKIPVLTEVYKPKASVKSLAEASDASEMTSDLISKVTAKIKPRLESEITEFVLDELKAEIKKAHIDVIVSTQNFVDKTKADLKTELPKMYQDSVRLAQVDTDAVKKAALDDVLEVIRKEMVDFQESVVREHQQQINETLASIAKRAEDSASEQIGIMHSRVGTMQQEAFAKLKEDFNAEKELMLKAAMDQIEATFSNKMTKEQQALQATIEAIINQFLPDIEQRLHTQLTTELQQLLVKVKFVLPEQ
jgi:hypothetical protein